MQRLIRIATVTASAALLVFAGNVRADVVDTRELMETIPVPANEPLVVIVKNIIGPIRVTGRRERRSGNLFRVEAMRDTLRRVLSDGQRAFDGFGRELVPEAGLIGRSVHSRPLDCATTSSRAAAMAARRTSRSPM